MAHYRFVTKWQVPSPLPKVWQVIYDYEHLPDWWKAVKKVRVIKHVRQDQGEGSIFECTWQSLIPYKLTFTLEVTEIIPGKKIQAKAAGDLVGWGTWLFSSVEGETRAEYIWDVHTTKRWMNLVAPIARPIFHWSHDWVMNQGEQGLKELLAGPAYQLKTEENEDAA